MRRHTPNTSKRRRTSTTRCTEKTAGEVTPHRDHRIHCVGRGEPTGGFPRRSAVSVGSLGLASCHHERCPETTAHVTNDRITPDPGRHLPLSAAIAVPILERRERVLSPASIPECGVEDCEWALDATDKLVCPVGLVTDEWPSQPAGEGMERRKHPSTPVLDDPGFRSGHVGRTDGLEVLERFEELSRWYKVSRGSEPQPLDTR